MVRYSVKAMGQLYLTLSMCLEVTCRLQLEPCLTDESQLCGNSPDIANTNTWQRVLIKKQLMLDISHIVHYTR